jgi:hypothetical protein
MALGLVLARRASPEGVDVGDHPPITPVKMATPKQCEGEVGWALYQLICRHFVASLSDAATFETATAQVELGGSGDGFEASATRCTGRGWTLALRVPVVGDTDDPETSQARFAAIASVRAGDPLRVVQAPASELGFTPPPLPLTESDLLSLMESHGIGTDASMATHVSNVIRRGYVLLDESSRSLTPSPLGLALIHAYTLIDEGLVLPCVRANIEMQCARIASGESTYDAVVGPTLMRFKGRYQHFVKHAHRLPSMLAVALAPETAVLGGTDGAMATQGGFAGSQAWMEAVAKTSAVRLDELKNVGSMRVQSALRGPVQASVLGGAGLPPGLQLPPGLAMSPPADPQAAAAATAASEAAEAMEAAEAIAEAQSALERLGYVSQPSGGGGRGGGEGSGDAASAGGDGGLHGDGDGGGGEAAAPSSRRSRKTGNRGPRSNRGGQKNK